MKSFIVACAIVLFCAVPALARAPHGGNHDRPNNGHYQQHGHNNGHYHAPYRPAPVYVYPWWYWLPRSNPYPYYPGYNPYYYGPYYQPYYYPPVRP